MLGVQCVLFMYYSLFSDRMKAGIEDKGCLLVTEERPGCAGKGAESHSISPARVIRK